MRRYIDAEREVDMAVMKKRLGFFRAGDTQRATTIAFKVGDRTHKKSGGANSRLREAVRLSRELIVSE